MSRQILSEVSSFVVAVTQVTASLDFTVDNLEDFKYEGVASLKLNKVHYKKNM